MLVVLNGKKDGFVGNDKVYIGRNNRFYGVTGSVLQNKFVIGKDGNRDEVVEKYREWLWENVKKGINGENNQVWNELVKIVKKVKEGSQVKLVCYCSPLKCHGDVIKRCVEWMIKEGLV